MTLYKNIFSAANLDIECPSCNHKFTITDTLEDGSKVQCPACKVDIELQHEESDKKTLDDIDRALADFERELKQYLR